MRLYSLSLLFLLTIPMAWGLAADSVAPQLQRHDRPDGPMTPTPVSISAYFVDILAINDVDGTLTIDYFIAQSWIDPRLSDANFPDSRAKLDLKLEDIWHPAISAVNLRSSILQEEILTIDSGGGVVFRQRRIDTFSTPLNLRRFPFDQQGIRMKWLSTFYGEGQIDIVWNVERSGHMEPFSVTGWSFEGFAVEKTELTVRAIKNLEKSLSGIDLKISMKRSSAFYLWKVILPLAFIVFMAWTVFWIDPAEFAGQVAISTSSVITLIAFQLSLGQLLPSISYLTRLDLYVVGTLFLVFFALGEAVLTARLTKNNKHVLAKRIDFHMRWSYPTVFLVMLLVLVL